jgi:hypothetical protein
VVTRHRATQPGSRARWPAQARGPGHPHPCPSPRNPCCQGQGTWVRQEVREAAHPRDQVEWGRSVMGLGAGRGLEHT